MQLRFWLLPWLSASGHSPEATHSLTSLPPSLDSDTASQVLALQITLPSPLVSSFLDFLYPPYLTPAREISQL